MTKEQEKLYEQMTDAIDEKTTCMINSYSKTLVATEKMLESTLGGRLIDPAEVCKRADMFWAMAVQRIDRDIAVAEQKESQVEMRAREDKQRKERAENGNPVVLSKEDMIKIRESKGESPCAKKAREAAEKIVSLEKEIEEKK